IASLLRPVLSREPAVVVNRTTLVAKAPLSRRKVKLASDKAGHFNASFKLNGRAIDGMIDTGATMVALNRSMARRIGLNLSPADFRYKVKTANGETAAAAAVIDEIEIGRIRVQRVEAVILDDR